MNERKGKFDNWEEVPTEELFEDGELSKEQVATTLFVKVHNQGIWKVIRRIK